MKRVLSIFCIFSLLTLQAGCGSGIFADPYDIANLRPIQVMGFDEQGDGFTVSIASGAGIENEGPLVMKTTSSRIETALVHLQDQATKDELYYAHVWYALLGQSLAEKDVMPVLEWIERNPIMRTDISIFVVKGSAAEAITTSVGEQSDITERLSAQEWEQKSYGQKIYTLREIVSSLADYGCALCTVIESVPSKGTNYTPNEEDLSAIIPAGIAILQEGAVIGYLTQDESIALDILTDGAIGTRIPVDSGALELLNSDVSIKGQWSDDGLLTGIVIEGELQAGILETDGETDAPAIQEELNDTISRWMMSLIACSQELACDFLHMEDKVFADAPKDSQVQKEDWDELFPSLPVTIQIKGEVDRNYELSA